MSFLWRDGRETNTLAMKNLLTKIITWFRREFLVSGIDPYEPSQSVTLLRIRWRIGSELLWRYSSVDNKVTVVDPKQGWVDQEGYFNMPYGPGTNLYCTASTKTRAQEKFNFMVSRFVNKLSSESNP